MRQRTQRRLFSRYIGNHMHIRYNGVLMDWRDYERLQGAAR